MSYTIYSGMNVCFRRVTKCPAWHTVLHKPVKSCALNVAFDKLLLHFKINILFWHCDTRALKYSAQKNVSPPLITLFLKHTVKNKSVTTMHTSAILVHELLRLLPRPKYIFAPSQGSRPRKHVFHSATVPNSGCKFSLTTWKKTGSLSRRPCCLITGPPSVLRLWCGRDLRAGAAACEAASRGYIGDYASSGDLLSWVSLSHHLIKLFPAIRLWGPGAKMLATWFQGCKSATWVKREQVLLIN